MIDSIAELLQRISLGEDSTIEFNQVLENRMRNSFADDVAALLQR